MSHDTLAAHYKTNHEIVSTHKYSLTEIENMMPYERDLIVEMIMADLEKEENAPQL